MCNFNYFKKKNVQKLQDTVFIPILCNKLQNPFEQKITIISHVVIKMKGSVFLICKFITNDK